MACHAGFGGRGRRSRARGRGRGRAPAAAVPWAAGVCFDAACRAAADRASLAAVLLPLFPLGGAALWAAGRGAEGAEGAAAAEEEGARPLARDGNGELVLRAESWRTFPVEEEAVGEVVRVRVGPVGARAPRSFLVGRRHPLGRLVVVELEKPWGLVFEEDPAGAAVVGDVVEGSAASRRNAVAKLRGTEATDAVLPGDVLRACTSINFVYGPGGLAGVAPPQRTVVLFGADGEAWPKVLGALKRNAVSDGPVTLVFERPPAAL